MQSNSSQTGSSKTSKGPPKRTNGMEEKNKQMQSLFLTTRHVALLFTEDKLSATKKDSTCVHTGRSTTQRQLSQKKFTNGEDLLNCDTLKHSFFLNQLQHRGIHTGTHFGRLWNEHLQRQTFWSERHWEDKAQNIFPFKNWRIAQCLREVSKKKSRSSGKKHSVSELRKLQTRSAASPMNNILTRSRIRMNLQCSQKASEIWIFLTWLFLLENLPQYPNCWQYWQEAPKKPRRWDSDRKRTLSTLPQLHRTGNSTSINSVQFFLHFNTCTFKRHGTFSILNQRIRFPVTLNRKTPEVFSHYHTSRTIGSGALLNFVNAPFVNEKLFAD